MKLMFVAGLIKIIEVLHWIIIDATNISFILNLCMSRSCFATVGSRNNSYGTNNALFSFVSQFTFIPDKQPLDISAKF